MILGKHDDSCRKPDPGFQQVDVGLAGSSLAG